MPPVLHNQPLCACVHVAKFIQTSVMRRQNASQHFHSCFLSFIFLFFDAKNGCRKKATWMKKVSTARDLAVVNQITSHA
jgi:hypothetical protein